MSLVVEGEGEDDDVLLSIDSSYRTTTKRDDLDYYNYNENKKKKSPSNYSMTSSSSTASSSSHLFTPVVLSILGTETAERFAYFGFRAVLVLYFTNDLYLDDNTAISCFAYTTCLANFSPLLGALLADGKLGRFRTILCFGSLYAIGLMILTYAAFLSNDGDAYRAHGVEDSLRKLFWKRFLTALGLILVCTGTGGIKPCVNIFGADQVALRDRGTTTTTISSKNNNNNSLKDHEEEEIIGRTATTQTDLEITSNEDHAVREFFNFFYFCINVGAVSSFALIPIVKRHFGFGAAFALPTICMISALALFYSKRHEYIYRQSESSNLAQTFRICFRLLKRKLKRRQTTTATTRTASRTGNSHAHHQLLQQDSIGDDQQQEEGEDQVEVLVERGSETHLQHDFTDEPLSLQVHSVRNTKAIHTTTWGEHQMALEDAHQALQILPIMAMLPMFWMLYDQQGSVWTLQASRMNLHGLEPEQLSMLNPLEIMLFIPLFDRIIYPTMDAQRINIAPLRRMGWGMVLAAISFMVSGFLEQVIETSPQDSVSVFWMIPQITILAVGEIFLSVTGLEYAYSRSPDRLKGFIMATYLLMIACGDLLGGILYSSVFRHMDRSVTMLFCAILMLVNRFVFGLVVTATQQDDDGIAASLPTPPPPQTLMSETYRDDPPLEQHQQQLQLESTNETKDDGHVPRNDSDGSIELIGDETQDAQGEPRDPSTTPLSASYQSHDLVVGEEDWLKEDWLNVEMSNLRVI